MEEVLKVKIVSDFRENYDHWFDSPHDSQLEFRRMLTEGISRAEMFKLFDESEMKTPQHGVVKDMFVGDNTYRKSKRTVIVYLDDKSHCGENKVKMKFSEAMIKYPNNYCSQYIPCCEVRSWRYLQIGKRAFVLLCSSDDEWRSNCGNVEIEVLGEIDEGGMINNKFPFAPYESITWMLGRTPPLFAVDFVADSAGTLYAVDYNSAPGIKYTGIEEILTHQEIANLIMDDVRDCYQRRESMHKLVESAQFRALESMFALKEGRPSDNHCEDTAEAV